MKISTSSLLYLIAIVLVLASLPVEWVELKNAPITYSSPFGSSDGGTIAAMSVTGLDGFFKPFGFSVPVWIFVLISEIGLLLSLCRFMRWADAPRMLCVVPLALTLAFVVIEWAAVVGQPPETGKETSTPEIGMVLCTVGLITGLVTILLRDKNVSQPTL
jgi:hypothetical protein